MEGGVGRLPWTERNTSEELNFEALQRCEHTRGLQRCKATTSLNHWIVLPCAIQEAGWVLAQHVGAWDCFSLCLQISVSQAFQLMSEWRSVMCFSSTLTDHLLGCRMKDMVKKEEPIRDPPKTRDCNLMSKDLYGGNSTDFCSRSWFLSCGWRSVLLNTAVDIPCAAGNHSFQRPHGKKYCKNQDRHWSGEAASLHEQLQGTFRHVFPLVVFKSPEPKEHEGAEGLGPCWGSSRETVEWGERKSFCLETEFPQTKSKGQSLPTSSRAFPGVGFHTQRKQKDREMQRRLGRGCR